MVQGYLHKQTVHPENTRFPYKNTLMFQKRPLTPNKTQRLPSVYSYLESLFLTTPFLVLSPSKFPEGMWLSVLFRINQHFFGLQSARLGELQKVFALCLSHTAPLLKRMDRLRDLAFSGETFTYIFPSYKQIHAERDMKQPGLALKDMRPIFPLNSMLKHFCGCVCEF